MSAKKKSTTVEGEKTTLDNPEVASLEQEVTEQELSLMEQLKQDAEDSKNYALRMRADLENMKKRNANLASDMYEEGKADTVQKMLPIFDNLEHAIKSEMPDEYRKGFEQIIKLKQDVFDKLNITEIVAVGAEFDPNLHNALMQVDNEEMSGKVVQVYETGYKIGGKVLRYSGVVVAK